MKNSKKLFTGLLSLLVVFAAGLISMSFGIIDAETTILAASSGATIVSTSQDRAAYSRFHDLLMQLNVIGSGSTPIITPTDLRLELSLSPNKNTYKFDPKKGTSSTDRPDENKLNVNDIFMVTAVALGIYKETDKVIYHYPDPNYFTAANEKTSLEALYRGKLSMTTDSTQRLNQMLTHHLRLVPPVQRVTPAQSGEANANDPAYGPLLEERGYYRLNPNILIDGSKTNSFDLDLGSGATPAIDGAANNNILVLQLHGFLFSGKVVDDQCAL